MSPLPRAVPQIPRIAQPCLLESGKPRTGSLRRVERFMCLAFWSLWFRPLWPRWRCSQHEGAGRGACHPGEEKNSALGLLSKVCKVW